MKRLKWIQLSSVGIDQVPVNYIKDKKIILTNNKGGYSIPIGEWITLKILEMLKNSRDFYEKQKMKKWKLDTSILELYGKTIGFIGTGSIAMEAAKRLKGFDVKILGLNTNGTPVEYFDKCYNRNELAYMLSLVDILILSIPYTEETHHLINNRALANISKGIYLVNISRGSIINEVDLINSLNEGKIIGAALDVFEEEPLKEDNPLWEMDNVIITPHNSWISEMGNERRFETIYNNMKSYINNEDLFNVVNLNRGY